MRVNSWRRDLERKRRGRPGEFPIGTLLFYGPDNRRASKVVASVFLRDGDEPLMAKWLWDGEMDVRLDRRIGREVTHFFEAHGVRRIATTQGLAGCPHEEGSTTRTARRARSAPSGPTATAGKRPPNLRYRPATWRIDAEAPQHLRVSA